MDRYTEQILKKKVDGGQKALFACGIAVILIGVCFILFIHFSLGVAIVAAGCFFAYVVRLAYDAEYEYLFVNGDCDVAVIINKSNRKDKYSFKESDVQRVLLYNSEVCQNEFQVNAELSVKDFTSGKKEKSDEWYVFFTNAKSRTVAVVLELNDRSLEHVRECYKNKLN